MSELFAHVSAEENVDKYASAGMDVYINIGKGNIGILGNHIYPNHRFAMRGTDDRLQKYLTRGVVALLAPGYGVAESVSVPEEQQKTKKKKAAEPEVSAPENENHIETSNSDSSEVVAPADIPVTYDNADGINEDSETI
jgi:hypothetical protein